MGFASAVDLGDPTSPYTPIHPRDKQPVGQRVCNFALPISFTVLILLKLADAAMNIAYGNTSIVWESPTMSNLSFFVDTKSQLVNVFVIFDIS